MSWMRLATFVSGAATVVAGFLIPGAQPVLVPAGVGLVMWATKWPGDSAKPKDPTP